MSLDFVPWPKIPRLSNTTWFFTEKIDGTNAAVLIRLLNADDEPAACEAVVPLQNDEGQWLEVGVHAQSRKRIITPDDDNFGFAEWVHKNADTLAAGLGPGAHFGEWWGVGIQRGYGLRERRFSLFNTHRWKPEDLWTSGLNDIGVYVVPILKMYGHLAKDVVDGVIDELKEHGSAAAPGFMDPEGIVIYSSATREKYKVLVKNDDVPKGSAEAEQSEVA